VAGLSLALLQVGVAHAGIPPVPCYSCGASTRGVNLVYGGSFHQRVKPPPGMGQGRSGPGGGNPDCSAIPLPAPPLRGLPPYQWPATPMPCAALTFTYLWFQSGTCSPPAQTYVELVSAVLFANWLPPGGSRLHPSSWVPPGRAPLCLTAQDFQAAGVAPPPGLMAISIWRQMSFPHPAIGMRPQAKGLANLESFFWVAAPFPNPDPFTQTRVVAVGPHTVTVHGMAARFDWGWGDRSAPLSTADPGSPWPARSPITHTYDHRGNYPVIVTVDWHGTFQIDGGAPQDVIGPDITATTTVTYPVQDLAITLTQ